MKPSACIAPFALACTLALNALAAGPAALGTSAAVDRQERLWVVYAEPAENGSLVKVQRYDEAAQKWLPALPVTSVAEPVAAEGENRPKLAFGLADEMYVTWTSPTSAKYTGDIRFSRSLDAGRTWSEPIVVHRDRQLITHRFESLLVDARGRIFVSWIDKRDLHSAETIARAYRGAAIYYAYSEDGGNTWRGDFKLADHSCECCRIALALDPQGRVNAMWRHVFEPNERDHAMAVLSTESVAPRVSRVTFDRWRIDACPHHGPGLAFARDGTAHAVWFNHVAGEARAFYGQIGTSAPSKVRSLPSGAAHADIAIVGRTVALAWKRFDGTMTRVETWISRDGGASFADGPTLQSASASDQPRLVTRARDIWLLWRDADGITATQLGVESAPISKAKPPPAEASPAIGPVRPFDADSLSEIEERHRGQPFWLVLWDLECSYCMKSLANIAAAQRTDPTLRVVTVTTDPISLGEDIARRLSELGVQSEAYAFSSGSPEALRYAIDSAWAGEKPRAYRYSPNGERRALSGVLRPEQFAEK